MATSPTNASATGLNSQDDRSEGIFQLLIPMLVLPCLVTILRFWSRALMPVRSKLQNSRFWWDDWLTLAALVPNVVVIALGFQLINLGLGKHLNSLPEANRGPALLLLWVEYYIWAVGIALTKASVLFFYARVFNDASPRFRLSLWVIHAVNATWMVAIVIAISLQCRPIQKVWKPELAGTCFNTDRLWLGVGIIDMLSDLVILIMPLPLLWKLQMRLARKAFLIAAFMCGYLVIVVTIGRVVAIFQAGEDLQNDETFNISAPFSWLITEIPVAIISVSLPSLFFLGKHVAKEGLPGLFHINGFGSTFSSGSRQSMMKSQASRASYYDEPGRKAFHEKNGTAGKATDPVNAHDHLLEDEPMTPGARQAAEP